MIEKGFKKTSYLLIVVYSPAKETAFQTNDDSDDWDEEIQVR